MGYLHSRPSLDDEAPVIKPKKKNKTVSKQFDEWFADNAEIASKRSVWIKNEMKAAFMAGRKSKIKEN